MREVEENVKNCCTLNSQNKSEWKDTLNIKTNPLSEREREIVQHFMFASLCSTEKFSALNNFVHREGKGMLRVYDLLSYKQP